MSEQQDPGVSPEAPAVSAGADGVAQAPVKEKRPRDPEKWIHRPIEKFRKGKNALPYRPSVEFFALADPLVQSQRTLLGYDRLYTFWQAIQNLEHVPGEVAEIGAYRGGSAYFVASALVAITGAEVPVHVFDTFEGHPAAALSEQDTFHKSGQFDTTSYDDVREFLSPFTQTTIHKGDVLQTMRGLTEVRYRLVHIDTDLYLPTKACLDYFGARLSPGAVVVLDDYASGKCPGVKAALVEYLEGRTDYQAWDLRTEQLMLVKR